VVDAVNRGNKKKRTTDHRYNNNNKNQKKTVRDDAFEYKMYYLRHYNMQSYKNILLYYFSETSAPEVGRYLGGVATGRKRGPIKAYYYFIIEKKTAMGRNYTLITPLSPTNHHPITVDRNNNNIYHTAGVHTHARASRILDVFHRCGVCVHSV